MAVARVGSPTAGGGFENVSSKTFSVTCTGGANNMLVVDVGYYDGSNNTTATVTYNGVAMTSLGKKSATTITKNQTESFGLLNPSAGANNVVITFGASGQYGACGAQEYSGVDATTPVENVTSAEGGNGSSSNSLVVTSAADNYAHFAALHTYGVGSPACDQTSVFTTSAVGGTVWVLSRDAAGASTVTFAHTWTVTGAGGGWSQLGFSIKASGGADTTAPTLTSPTGTQTGSTTGSGTVSTDEGNGTLYYWATTNATETAADVKTSGGSQAVSGTGSQGVSFTGLSPSTAYYAHYVHRDAAGNDSTRVSSSSFTTTSGASSLSKVIQQMGA